MQDLAEAFFPSATSCGLYPFTILTMTLICGKDKYMQYIVFERPFSILYALFIFIRKQSGTIRHYPALPDYFN